MTTVRLLHQIDVYNNQVVNEWWLLDGIGYHEGQPLKSEGFKWIPGPDGGCWQAPSIAALAPLINGGVEVVITGNGKELTDI